MRADGTATLRGRKLSIHLMMQPDVAARLYGDDVLKDQGFTARFLVVAPASLMGTRLFCKQTDQERKIIEAFQIELAGRLALDYPLRPNSLNELEPRTLPFSNEARAVWIAFINSVEVQLGPTGNLRPIRGFAAKSGEHVGRIAAILSWWENVAATEVSADAVACAIALVRHYTDEALRLNQVGAIEPELLAAQTLLNWLHGRNDTLTTVRDIVRLGPYCLRSSISARAAIDILVAHRWLKAAPRGTVVGNRKCRDVWTVTPKPKDE